jgi:Holliday junction resolvase RusA-like endonuclease
MITFTVPGEPCAKQRPRVTKFGTYTPEKTVVYENLVKTIAQQAMQGKQLLEGKLQMRIIANFKIPNTISKKKHEDMCNGNIRPIKRPDIDNIAKAIADSLNNIVYKDDSQIVTIIASKWYSDIPEVFVEITTII